MKIDVYSDGSATSANKPGGWGYVLTIDDVKYAERAGHSEGASNNDMELEASIQGLAAALKYVNQVQSLDMIAENPQGYTFNVTLCSDSQLVLGWASGRYSFKQLDKLEKYKQLKFLVTRLNAQTRWIKGHSGDEHNERCDKLANEARLGVNREQDRKEALASGKTLIGTKKSGTVNIWYKDKLKIVDFEANVCEDYDRSIHGPRGGIIEIREDKSR